MSEGTENRATGVTSASASEVESDSLDLKDLFDSFPKEGPTKDQMYKMYGIFLGDFKVSPPTMKNGEPLQYNKNPSKHPLCKGKALAFEHIITRGEQKRSFDPYRANKIHWIKPIIENVNDPRILYFEREQGYKFQHFFWYKTKGFIVIVREVSLDIQLITSFAVDQERAADYSKWHAEYISEQKKTSLRK